MIACAFWFVSAQGQSDTVCLKRGDVIQIVNDLARCDSAGVVLSQRVDLLEDVRAELLIQIDAGKEIRQTQGTEISLYKDCVDLCRRDLVRQKLLNKIIIGCAVAAEIATIYLLVR